MSKANLAAELDGRVALVTGAAHGIGEATFRVLAEAGAQVVGVDIDEPALHGVVESIGVAAQAIVCDVRDDAAVATMTANMGVVDILVNNVGHYLRPTPFHRSDPAKWDALYDVNLRHVFTVTRGLLPGMIERGSGAIVNVASVEGVRGYPPDPVYGAYKAAVIHFTRCLAMELAPMGIRVNAIAPDVTQTQQVDYDAMVPEDQRHLWPMWVPVGRMGQPGDNADVIRFLASDASRFVTGHVVPTDGGTLAAGGWFRTGSGRRWTNRPREA